MERLFETRFDCSHWGITDLYDDMRDGLVKLLESGEDFDTGWGSCKKEIESMRIVASGDNIEVTVCVGVDGLGDIVWGVFADNAFDATDTDYDKVCDLICFCTDYVESTDDSVKIKRDSTIEDVLSAASKLCDELHKYTSDGWESAVTLCEEYIMIKRGEITV